MNPAATALASLQSLPLGVEPLAVVSSVVYALIAVAIVGVVITLLTDDRDPSTVLAWLFVIMLLPVFGIILYFFIGRNYRRDNRKNAQLRLDMRGLVERSLAPTREANAAFTEAAIAALAGTAGGRIEATGHKESRFLPQPVSYTHLTLPTILLV